MRINTKDTIALFGTSADPPTIGHKKILEELSKIYSFTITYASNNPKKKHEENISMRSILLKALVEDLDNPKIIFNQTISSQWAFESIEKAQNKYKLHKIDFVIGSDLILDIFSWKHSEKIIKEVNFFIIERGGYPVKSNTLKILSNRQVKFKLSTIDIPNISSSMVRLNKNYSDLPKSLINIVKRNNLYIHKNS